MRLGMVVGFIAGILIAGGMAAFGGPGAAQETAHLQLRQGWNQVVWSSEDQPADAALSGLDDLQIAYAWDSGIQSFSRYVPDRAELNTLAWLEQGDAYWLLMGADGFLPIALVNSEAEYPGQPTCPTAIPCPDSMSCPPAVVCAPVVACPAIAAVCPTATWAICCAEIREVGNLLEAELMACEIFDLVCEDTEQKLAILDAFVGALCE